MDGGTAHVCGLGRLARLRTSTETRADIRRVTPCTSVAFVGRLAPPVVSLWQDSKLCNMMFMAEASRRLAAQKITVNAFSPGLIADPNGFFRNQASNHSGYTCSHRHRELQWHFRSAAADTAFLYSVHRHARPGRTPQRSGCASLSLQ